MRTRYRIAHRSLYDYDRAVGASFNEARLTPAQTPWQARLESRIAIDPVTWNHRYVDYWGTEVRVFEADRPHRSLEVRATSLVELDPGRRLPPGTAGWRDLAAPAVRDRFAEFLTQTAATEPPAELAERARAIAAGHDPVRAAWSIGEAVHDAVTYRTGVTAVHTTA